MTTTNMGPHVRKVMEALAEFGRLTAQEFADYADIERYDAHAVLNRMSRRTKAGEKRIHVAGWVYTHDNARRYPRPVFAMGDFPDKAKPKSNLRENRRRSEEKMYTLHKMNSVFNMGLNREAVREIRKNLHQ